MVQNTPVLGTEMAVTTYDHGAMVINSILFLAAPIII